MLLVEPGGMSKVGRQALYPEEFRKDAIALYRAAIPLFSGQATGSLLDVSADRSLRHLFCA